MVGKRQSSPDGDFQPAGVGKHLVMPLMVFEQVAASGRMKLGGIMTEAVWHGCLKYKEAG